MDRRGFLLRLAAALPFVAILTRSCVGPNVLPVLAAQGATAESGYQAGRVTITIINGRTGDPIEATEITRTLRRRRERVSRR